MSRKCQSIHFTSNIDSFDTTQYLDGPVIQKATKVKDFAILIDNRLRFTKHMDDVLSKSMSMLNYIKRNNREF